MKLTKKQRAEVVEVLRCAADHWNRRVIDGVAEAFALHGDKVHYLATEAWCSGPDGSVFESLLETAACIEEGSLP